MEEPKFKAGDKILYTRTGEIFIIKSVIKWNTEKEPYRYFLESKYANILYINFSIIKDCVLVEPEVEELFKI